MQPVGRPFYLKFLVALAAVVGAYAAFMAVLDPYFLLGSDPRGKTLPYNTWYTYNLARQVDRLDYAFLGSSQVNYFPIGEMYPGAASLFSMGMESSNIQEHVAYGRSLVRKRPAEIWFFITFYALNPSRGAQNYFNGTVVALDSLPVDFVYEYFHESALADAVRLARHRRALSASWVREFNSDGTRTQNFYRLDRNYDFNRILADYLAWLKLDPRYYNSRTFRDPGSIAAGIRAIAEFKAYAEKNGVRVRLATAPTHRMDHALIYREGLGPTYEAYRRELARLGPFVDLDLDIDLTSGDRNFWDTHHTRAGSAVVAALKSGRYVVTADNVEATTAALRPTAAEQGRLQGILDHYPRWAATKKALDEDLARTPPRAP